MLLAKAHPAPETGDAEFDYMFAGTKPKPDLLRAFEDLRRKRHVPHAYYDQLSHISTQAQRAGIHQPGAQFGPLPPGAPQTFLVGEAHGPGAEGSGAQQQTALLPVGSSAWSRRNQRRQVSAIVAAQTAQAVALQQRKPAANAARASLRPGVAARTATGQRGGVRTAPPPAAGPATAGKPAGRGSPAGSGGVAVPPQTQRTGTTTRTAAPAAGRAAATQGLTGHQRGPAVAARIAAAAAAAGPPLGAAPPPASSSPSRGPGRRQSRTAAAAGPSSTALYQQYAAMPPPRQHASPPRAKSPQRTTAVAAAAPIPAHSSTVPAQQGSTRQQKLQALKAIRQRQMAALASEPSDLMRMVQYADQAASEMHRHVAAPVDSAASSSADTRAQSPPRITTATLAAASPAKPATSPGPPRPNSASVVTRGPNPVPRADDATAGPDQGATAPQQEQQPVQNPGNGRPRMADMVRKFREDLPLELADGRLGFQQDGSELGSTGEAEDEEDEDEAAADPVAALASAVLQRSHALLRERDAIKQRIQSALTKFHPQRTNMPTSPVRQGAAHTTAAVNMQHSPRGSSAAAGDGAGPLAPRSAPWRDRLKALLSEVGQEDVARASPASPQTAPLQPATADPLELWRERRQRNAAAASGSVAGASGLSAAVTAASSSGQAAGSRSEVAAHLSLDLHKAYMQQALANWASKLSESISQVSEVPSLRSSEPPPPKAGSGPLGVGVPAVPGPSMQLPVPAGAVPSPAPAARSSTTATSHVTPHRTGSAEDEGLDDVLARLARRFGLAPGTRAPGLASTRAAAGAANAWQAAPAPPLNMPDTGLASRLHAMAASQMLAPPQPGVGAPALAALTFSAAQPAVAAATITDGDAQPQAASSSAPATAVVEKHSGSNIASASNAAVMGTASISTAAAAPMASGSASATAAEEPGHSVERQPSASSLAESILSLSVSELSASHLEPPADGATAGPSTAAYAGASDSADSLESVGANGFKLQLQAGVQPEPESSQEPEVQSEVLDSMSDEASYASEGRSPAQGGWPSWLQSLGIPRPVDVATLPPEIWQEDGQQQATETGVPSDDGNDTSLSAAGHMLGSAMETGTHAPTATANQQAPAPMHATGAAHMQLQRSLQAPSGASSGAAAGPQPAPSTSSLGPRAVGRAFSAAALLDFASAPFPNLRPVSTTAPAAVQRQLAQETLAFQQHEDILGVAGAGSGISSPVLASLLDQAVGASLFADTPSGTASYRSSLSPTPLHMPSTGGLHLRRGRMEGDNVMSASFDSTRSTGSNGMRLAAMLDQVTGALFADSPMASQDLSGLHSPLHGPSGSQAGSAVVSGRSSPIAVQRSSEAPARAPSPLRLSSGTSPLAGMPTAKVTSAGEAPTAPRAMADSASSNSVGSGDQPGPASRSASEVYEDDFVELTEDTDANVGEGEERVPWSRAEPVTAGGGVPLRMAVLLSSGQGRMSSAGSSARAVYSAAEVSGETLDLQDMPLGVSSGSLPDWAQEEAIEARPFSEEAAPGPLGAAVTTLGLNARAPTIPVPRSLSPVPLPSTSSATTSLEGTQAPSRVSWPTSYSAAAEDMEVLDAHSGDSRSTAAGRSGSASSSVPPGDAVTGTVHNIGSDVSGNNVAERRLNDVSSGEESEATLAVDPSLSGALPMPVLVVLEESNDTLNDLLGIAMGLSAGLVPVDVLPLDMPSRRPTCIIEEINSSKSSGSGSGSSGVSSSRNSRDDSGDEDGSKGSTQRPIQASLQVADRQDHAADERARSKVPGVEVPLEEVQALAEASGSISSEVEPVAAVQPKQQLDQMQPACITPAPVLSAAAVLRAPTLAMPGPTSTSAPSRSTAVAAAPIQVAAAAAPHRFEDAAPWSARSPSGLSPSTSLDGLFASRPGPSPGTRGAPISPVPRPLGHAVPSHPSGISPTAGPEVSVLSDSRLAQLLLPQSLLGPAPDAGNSSAVTMRAVAATDVAVASPAAAVIKLPRKRALFLSDEPLADSMSSSGELVLDRPIELQAAAAPGAGQQGPMQQLHLPAVVSRAAAQSIASPSTTGMSRIAGQSLLHGSTVSTKALLVVHSSSEALLESIQQQPAVAPSSIAPAEPTGPITANSSTISTFNTMAVPAVATATHLGVDKPGIVTPMPVLRMPLQPQVSADHLLGRMPSPILERSLETRPSASSSQLNDVLLLGSLSDLPMAYASERKHPTPAALQQHHEQQSSAHAAAALQHASSTEQSQPQPADAAPTPWQTTTSTKGVMDTCPIPQLTEERASVASSATAGAASLSGQTVASGGPTRSPVRSVAVQADTLSVAQGPGASADGDVRQQQAAASSGRPLRQAARIITVTAPRRATAESISSTSSSDGATAPLLSDLAAARRAVAAPASQEPSTAAGHYHGPPDEDAIVQQLKQRITTCMAQMKSWEQQLKSPTKRLH